MPKLGQGVLPLDVKADAVSMVSWIRNSWSGSNEIITSFRIVASSNLLCLAIHPHLSWNVCVRGFWGPYSSREWTATAFLALKTLCCGINKRKKAKNMVRKSTQVFLDGTVQDILMCEKPCNVPMQLSAIKDSHSPRKAWNLDWTCVSVWILSRK